MGKYKYSKVEQQFNNVLKYQDEELNKISFDHKDIENSISSSEELLKSLGYSINTCKSSVISKTNKVIIVPTWEKLCNEAELCVGNKCELDSIFTPLELESNEIFIKELNADFNNLHKLDKIDITISSIASLIGATTDILLVGIPKKTSYGMSAGVLSNFIRNYFDNRFPGNELEKLANMKMSKVSFDAQDNRYTTKYVTGLSAYYHRLLSLGHDPLLGFIVGVFDIVTGRMTTIDKTGKIVSQVMENYNDRKEVSIFVAIAKQIIHFKSDVTTSMGLPAPLMGLFNLLQFGSIGEEEQTIAEIVQGMYYEGYDFIHFCSMSIPTMIIEVLIRILYAIKRINEGRTIKESIPYSLSREKNPKLSTMLFIAHSGATAINAGKVYFTKNPMAINYVQWIAFAKYSYTQLKWILIQNPKLRDIYVDSMINNEMLEIYNIIDESWEELTKKYIVVME